MRAAHGIRGFILLSGFLILSPSTSAIAEDVGTSRAVIIIERSSMVSNAPYHRTSGQGPQEKGPGMRAIQSTVSTRVDIRWQHKPAMPVVNGPVDNIPSLDDSGKATTVSEVPYHRGQPQHGITPYGDFCERCSKYGMGTSNVPSDIAVEAMRQYFSEQGLTIDNIQGTGRFMKADIFREDIMVDRVIFDRRTGRLRSIY